MINEQTGIWATIKNSFRLWWNTLPGILPLSIIVSLLINWPFFTKAWIDPQAQKDLYIALNVIFTVISLIPYCAIFPILKSAAASTQRFKISQALAQVLLRFGSLFLLFILLLFILGTPIGLGIFAFTYTKSLALLLLGIIICILLSVYVICALPLTINENFSATQAIKRSFQLVHHHWGYTFLVLLVVYSFNILIERLGLSAGVIFVVIANMLCTSLQIAAAIIIVEQLKLRYKKI